MCTLQTSSKSSHFLYCSVAIYRGRGEADLLERAPGRLDVLLLQGTDHPLRGVELDQAR